MAKRVNLDTSETVNITCRRGDTFNLTLTLKDSSGTAIQLSTLGYEFLMEVRDQINSCFLAAMGLAPGDDTPRLVSPD